MIQEKDIRLTGRYTAILALSEVGLGSGLHALHIPLSGQILSLNQGFLLCRLTQESQNISHPAIVSAATALIKSLSPIGKRLTPMLAISAQGLLYSLGLTLFGTNAIGQLVGFWLLSLWAYIQGLLILYFIFGHSLISTFQFYLNEILTTFNWSTQHAYWLVGSLVLLKLLLATMLFFLSRNLSEKKWRAYLEKVNKIARAQPLRDHSRSAHTFFEKIKWLAKDLLQPWFLLTFALTTLFFFVTSKSGVSLVWSIMRPLAGALIFFYIVRYANFEKCVAPFRSLLVYRVTREALLQIRSLAK